MVRIVDLTDLVFLFAHHRVAAAKWLPNLTAAESARYLYAWDSA
jgi:hypothetical protein